MDCCVVFRNLPEKHIFFNNVCVFYRYVQDIVLVCLQRFLAYIMLLSNFVGGLGKQCSLYRINYVKRQDNTENA